MSMKKSFAKIKEFLIDMFFPRFCLGCSKEGSWLCEDCQAILDIRNVAVCPICLLRTPDFKTCNRCKNKTNLSGLLWPLPYQNLLVKKLIHQFKYDPFIKELSFPLANCIINHLLLIEFSREQLKDFILIPIPLHNKRKKWRGFNQAEEIAKEIGNYFDIPVLNNVLTRQKETLPQIDLEEKQRKENIKGVFVCQKPELIKNRKIFLVDDVYTTGSTMEEATKILKSAGAKEVWGLVIARG